MADSVCQRLQSSIFTWKSSFFFSFLIHYYVTNPRWVSMILNSCGRQCLSNAFVPNIHLKLFILFQHRQIKQENFVCSFLMNHQLVGEEKKHELLIQISAVNLISWNIIDVRKTLSVYLPRVVNIAVSQEVNI